jgi:hypothetical protein
MEPAGLRAQRGSQMRHFTITLLILSFFTFIFSEASAESSPPTWLKRYYEFFTENPEVAGDGRAASDEVRRIRSALESNTLSPEKKSGLEAWLRILDKSQMVWTGTSPIMMSLHILTPTELITIPNGKLSAFLDPVHSGVPNQNASYYHYSMDAIDPDGKLPPLRLFTTSYESNIGSRQVALRANTSSLRVETDAKSDRTQTVFLDRGAYPTRREELRKAILEKIQKTNERYALHRLTIGHDDKKGENVDPDRDREKYLGGLKKALQLFPVGEDDDKEIRDALVIAIAKFEERFKPGGKVDEDEEVHIIPQKN